jgi:hypothetical protein
MGDEDEPSGLIFSFRFWMYKVSHGTSVGCAAATGSICVVDTSPSIGAGGASMIVGR